MPKNILAPLEKIVAITNDYKYPHDCFYCLHWNNTSKHEHTRHHENRVFLCKYLYTSWVYCSYLFIFIFYCKTYSVSNYLIILCFFSTTADVCSWLRKLKLTHAHGQNASDSLCILLHKLVGSTQWTKRHTLINSLFLFFMQGPSISQ